MAPDIGQLFFSYVPCRQILHITEFGVLISRVLSLLSIVPGQSPFQTFYSSGPSPEFLIKLCGPESGSRPDCLAPFYEHVPASGP